ncbi:MAG: alanine racemase [Alkaliphilus sp.]
MKKHSIETPCVVVDLAKMESNISEMANLAEKHKVELWPMIKTHKSEYIVKEQLKSGAKGILVAKISEAEVLINSGVKRIMLAYPLIGDSKLKRLKELAKSVEVTCSIDSVESAEILSSAAIFNDITFDYVIIVDSGLKRLGVLPTDIESLYESIKNFKGINLVGVATHGGHVYGALNKQDVITASEQEKLAILSSSNKLKEQEGVDLSIIALGSTPTVETLLNFEGVKQIRPGNYVFYDAIQVALGIVPKERCALTVLATVISIPQKGRAIIDAGSKILCLDAGAHGNTSIKGYGIVKNHSGVLVDSLSEELGKLKYDADKYSFKIGQRIEIIPNHACTVTNMVDEVYGIRDEKVEVKIDVSARGLSQ